MMKQARYKQQTMKAYDHRASNDAAIFDNYFAAYAQSEARAFLSMLTPDSIIVDLGCGGGAASAYFQQQRHVTISADLSPMMLQECQKRGLEHLVCMDLEAPPFLQCSVDAIWAHTSLLHIPKAHLRGALHGIGKILKPQGLCLIALKEGKGEGYAGYSGAQKWFSLFQAEEFTAYLPFYFEIIRTNRLKTTQQTFLYYCLMKTWTLKEQE